VCPEELAALVEHALLDDLVCLEQERLGNRQAERHTDLQLKQLLPSNTDNRLIVVRSSGAGAYS
jgi:hypothetical protein